MTQVTSGYERALAIAREALDAEPRARLPMPDSASSLGDVAAHLVASAATRNPRQRIEGAVARHLKAGMDAIVQLSVLTDDPDPTAPVAATIGPQVKGKVGREWSFNGGFVHHYGHSWQLSGAIPGLFLTLPRLHPNMDEMGRRFRSELEDAGLPSDVVARGHARAGVNPYGLDDERPWTEFVLPMVDRRLDYVGSIVDLGHVSSFRERDSLGTYARQASAIHENAESLSRMMDAAEEVCMDAADEVPSLQFEDVSINSVSIGRIGKLKDAVVIHARFKGLSEALTRIEIKGILTGNIGMMEPSTTSTPQMVVEQLKRYRALTRLGGPTIDRTGLDLLRAAGHDVDEMLDRLRGKLGMVDTRVHAGTGTNAWLRISAGRITATVSISPEARWKHDHIEIRRELPQSVIASLAGRAASDVVGHPALHGATVRSGRMLRNRALVSVEPRWEPLD